MSDAMGKIVVLTGGIGGAKLVLGLTRIVPPGDLTAIVNTGDDFRHLGLHVSPDIDTLLYTLSGLASGLAAWVLVSRVTTTGWSRTPAILMRRRSGWRGPRTRGSAQPRRDPRARAPRSAAGRCERCRSAAPAPP